MHADDSALLAAARAGDPAALDRLVAGWQGKVYRFGLRMCGHEEDARDVLQDTLLAAARSLPEFRGDAAVSTWLFKIARSFCTKQRRRSVFAPAEELSLDALRAQADGAEVAGLPPAAGPDPEQSTAATQIRAALDRAIRGLDPKYREVLLLRDVEGLTAPQVAEALGLQVATVKTRLHRARLALRTAVAPLLASPAKVASTAATPRGSSAAAPKAAGADCPDLPLFASQYLEGDVTPERCAALEQHVAHCQHCAAACAALRETVRLCRDLPAGPIPAEVVARVRANLAAAASGGA